MLKDALTISVYMLGEPHPLSPCRQFLPGMLPVILTIQFEQVEGIQKDLLVMGTEMQLVEIRLAVLPSPNRFPSTMMERTRRDRSASTILRYLPLQS